MLALFIGVTFTIKNSQIVELTYYFDVHWQGPLSWLVIIVFACGLVIGILGVKAVSMKRRLFGTKDANKPIPQKTSQV